MELENLEMCGNVATPIVGVFDQQLRICREDYRRAGIRGQGSPVSDRIVDNCVTAPSIDSHHRKRLELWLT